MSESKIIMGKEVVGKYRDYDIVRSDSGAFGFNAWSNKALDGYMCFYNSKEGAEKAIDAILKWLLQEDERSNKTFR